MTPLLRICSARSATEERSVSGVSGCTRCTTSSRRWCRSVWVLPNDQADTPNHLNRNITSRCGADGWRLSTCSTISYKTSSTGSARSPVHPRLRRWPSQSWRSGLGPTRQFLRSSIRCFLNLRRTLRSPIGWFVCIARPTIRKGERSPIRITRTTATTTSCLTECTHTILEASPSRRFRPEAPRKSTAGSWRPATSTSWVFGWRWGDRSFGVRATSRAASRSR